MSTRLILVLSLSAVLGACGGDGGIGGGDDDGAGGGDGGAGGGGDGGVGDPDGVACKKIDLVISVDPSGSMDTELTAMSSVFGDFASALLAVNADFENFRTGVVDACPNPAAFNTSGGAGACNFASGQGWIDSASPSMVSEFQCVGDIDISTGYACNPDDDSDEQPIKAAIASLAANPGFVRDDALLVVLGITDEDEEMVIDATNEETWTGPELAAHAQGLHDALVTAKGNPSNVVFIGVAGGMPDGCASGAYGAADPAEIMDATADRFIADQRGVKWDLCDGNLDQALSDALVVIQQACDEFENPIE